MSLRILRERIAARATIAQLKAEFRTLADERKHDAEALAEAQARIRELEQALRNSLEFNGQNDPLYANWQIGWVRKAHDLLNSQDAALATSEEGQ